MKSETSALADEPPPDAVHSASYLGVIRENVSENPFSASYLHASPEYKEAEVYEDHVFEGEEEECEPEDGNAVGGGTAMKAGEEVDQEEYVEERWGYGRKGFKISGDDSDDEDTFMPVYGVERLLQKLEPETEKSEGRIGYPSDAAGEESAIEGFEEELAPESLLADASGMGQKFALEERQAA